MRVIKPKIEILDKLDQVEILKRLELIGRTCYKSEERITEDSCAKFVEFIINNGHHSILEHVVLSVRAICDRGVSHEIVRHRIASYAQESTRYCNYSHDKFGNEITVIIPNFWRNSNDNCKWEIWESVIKTIERGYLELIELGATPQEARSILPNSLKTEIVMTYNLREWRYFLSLRSSPKAHPQMIEIAEMILSIFKEKLPVLFGDIPLLK